VVPQTGVAAGEFPPSSARHSVTLVLKVNVASNSTVLFESDEAAAGRPERVVLP
jgi:hypothetical protein